MSIAVERDSGVVRLTIDRPERRNALTVDGFAELGRVLGEIARTPADRAVLITGAGGAFCAGADLSAGVPDESVVRIMERINDTARALHRLPQPTVAAVGGPAVGAGMSLALGCDLVVASPAATFCQVFVKRGLSPDFGSSWLLPRLVGLQAAKRLALLGDTITAEHARDLGLVSEVTAADDLLDTATALARRLADGPPIALALTKRLLDASFTSTFDDALDAEAAASAVNTATEDVAEAFAAFAAKRPAVFRGR
ncbi:enoyl-CoA hydratase-related protein [Dactylosporangium sp. AC04546]|uniref:enoyl-CoA hydratase/isomerase family protein n=1 Tax=Dactylosporangium sp. AC04546 TaxID=2862460 RepID=UPI001EE0E085|nr:enoyl-CoA hydratase-related protein [Dactylosporangium sp. AC04546]WVK87281.1 enoyl-CoA hydratase-related protein [Dactylosporangium sp. AC04546]